jgi:hypothetical protein
MSVGVLGFILVAAAALLYGAVVLYGAWIDGRRQKVRERGGHPVTDARGDVRDEDEE